MILDIKIAIKRNKSYKRQKFKSFKISERFWLKTIIRDKIIPPSILFIVVKLFPQGTEKLDGLSFVCLSPACELQSASLQGFFSSLYVCCLGVLSKEMCDFLCVSLYAWLVRSHLLDLYVRPWAFSSFSLFRQYSLIHSNKSLDILTVMGDCLYLLF